MIRKSDEQNDQQIIREFNGNLLNKNCVSECEVLVGPDFPHELSTNEPNAANVASVFSPHFVFLTLSSSLCLGSAWTKRQSGGTK